MKGYQLNPQTVDPFAVNGLLAISQILMAFFGGKIPLRIKVQGMYFSGAVLVISLPFLAHGVPSTAGKFWSCFAVLFAYGPVNGIVQGTVFGLAGFLPSEYAAAVMVGNGLSGILCALVSLLLVIVLPGEENLYTQALIFYIWATLVLLISAMAYPFVTNSKFFRYYQAKTVKKDGESQRDSNIPPEAKEEAAERAPRLTFREFVTQFQANFKTAGSMLLSLMWVFVVTFTVFAAAFLTAGFDFDAGENHAEWDLQCVMITFNFLDTVGRTLGGRIGLQRRSVMVLSLLRTVFVFTTLATAVRASPTWLFCADWFRLLNLALFSVSNGFVSTRCMILAPKMVGPDQ